MCFFVISPLHPEINLARQLQNCIKIIASFFIFEEKISESFPYNYENRTLEFIKSAFNLAKTGACTMQDQ